MDDPLLEFRRHAARRPSAPSLFGPEVALTFGEVDTASDRFAGALAAAGLKAGDRAMWIGDAGPERAVMVLGALKAGVIFAMPDMKHPDTRLAEMAAAAVARALIVAPDHMERAKGMKWRGPVVAAPDLRRSPATDFTMVDPASTGDVLISFTSGSTGAPKAIAKRRRDWAYFTELAIGFSNLGPADTVGLLGNAWQPTIISGFAAGARVGCYDVGQRGLAGLVDWLTAERISVMMIYPAIFRQIAAAGRRLPDLRHLTLIGEPLTRRDAEAFSAITRPGAVLANVLGSMEVTYIFKHEYRSGDPVDFEVMPLGAPVHDNMVRLVDENGDASPLGAVGEVVFESVHAPGGYLAATPKSDEAARAGRNGIAAFRTGDLAYCDYRGVYHSAGRRDLRTKIRGYTVDPVEVEEMIAALPGVDEVAVVAADGPFSQRRLVCHYVGVATPEEMRAALASKVADYMIPSVWRPVKSLPRTPSGKVRRAALSDAIVAKERPEGFSSAGADQKAVAQLYAAILGHDSFGSDDDFFDLGGDSLQAMTLELELERRFGRRVPPDALILNGASVRSVARLVGSSRECAEVMRPGDGGRTVALAHLIGGRLADYLPLVHAFDRRKRILGLRARGMDGGGGDAGYRRMAQHAVRQLRDTGVGDRAGLTVLGYSFGAPLALEVARLMSADGVAPDVVMLDPWAPWTDPKRWLRPAAASLRSGAPLAAVSDALRAAGGAVGLAPGGLDAAHRAAWLRYRPRPLAGLRGLLIHTEALDAVRAADAWRSALGAGLTLRPTPGNHVSMMKEPLAGPLAQVIQGWMAAAPADQASSIRRKSSTSSAI